MSDYILTSNGELYHYGVKGMKWGVRRAIGKQAREHARTYYKQKRYSKKSAKLQKQIDELKSVKEYTNVANRLKKEKSKVDKVVKNLDKAAKQTINGLSQKDIAQGKREVVALKIMKTALASASFVSAVSYGSGVAGRAKMLYEFDFDGGASVTNEALKKMGYRSRADFIF